MIIEFLLNMILKLVALLFGSINLPPTPKAITEAFASILDALDYAKTFIPLFFPIDVSVYISLAISLFVIGHVVPPLKFIILKLIRGAG